MANTIWQWFQENEATAGGVTDKIASYMARQGYVAATNEMLYNWLKDLGYSITLNEMLAKFEEENPSMIDGFIKSEANVLSTVSSNYTFSLTGGQTGINSASQIYQAERKNLLTYSEDFANAAWVTNGTVTKTSNYATAPNGTQTADRLVFATASSANQIFQTFTSSAIRYTSSIWMRVESGSKQIKFGFFDGTSVLTDYVTLTTTWQRFSVNKQVVAFGATRGCWIYPDTTGDATDILVWGAQLEPGPFATAYIPTTTAAVTVSDPAYIAGQGILLEGARTNLLTYSRDMTNGVWTKTDTTVTRNQTGADGAASSACLITEGSAGTATLAAFPGGITAGSTITGSMILKRGNTDWVRLTVSDSALVDGGNGWFNLATGEKGAVTASGAGTNNSSSITSLGNGWYRCTITTTPNATYTAGGMFIVSASANSSTTRVSGATYIVDYAQLEVGPFASSPIETVAAAVTRNATSLSRSWTLPANNFSGQIKLRLQFARGQLINQSFFAATDGTTSNRFQIAISSAGYVQFVKSVAGTSLFGASSVLNFASRDLLNIRFKQDTSGFHFWINSGTKTSSTTGIAPNDFSVPLTLMYLNQNISGATPMFTVFESLKIWHEAKSDSFLAALT
jgi:hypothetical protein